MDAPFIGEFLDHLEKEREVTARSRNTRLAAIHSFFQYVSFQEPARADQCRRILAIPNKRYERRLIEHLKPEEIDALLAEPDQATWIGRRDRALLLLAIQTGLRVSELIGSRRDDVVLGTGAHVRCEGKGRKERCTPLRPDVVAVLAEWFRECPAVPLAPAFPSSRGGPLSRDAVERLVARHQCSAGVGDSTGSIVDPSLINGLSSSEGRERAHPRVEGPRRGRPAHRRTAPAAGR